VRADRGAAGENGERLALGSPLQRIGRSTQMTRR